MDLFLVSSKVATRVYVLSRLSKKNLDCQKQKRAKQLHTERTAAQKKKLCHIHYRQEQRRLAQTTVAEVPRFSRVCLFSLLGPLRARCGGSVQCDFRVISRAQLHNTSKRTYRLKSLPSLNSAYQVGASGHCSGHCFFCNCIDIQKNN